MIGMVKDCALARIFWERVVAGKEYVIAGKNIVL